LLDAIALPRETLERREGAGRSDEHIQLADRPQLGRWIEVLRVRRAVDDESARAFERAAGAEQRGLLPAPFRLRRGSELAQVLARGSWQVRRDGVQQRGDQVRLRQREHLRPALCQGGEQRNAPKQREQRRLRRLRPPFGQLERKPHLWSVRDRGRRSRIPRGRKRTENRRVAAVQRAASLPALFDGYRFGQIAGL